MPGLIGRVDERVQLYAMLAAARRGDSGGLVIFGEPGVGKPRLLEAGGRAGRRLSRVAGAGCGIGVRSRVLGFPELARPAIGRVDELPDAQRRALESALALGGSGAVDRFAVDAATLGLLALTAEEQPGLCAVDDAQWLDRAFGEAPSFATRRLSAEGVVMLFGARDSEALGVRARAAFPSWRLLRTWPGRRAPTGGGVVDRTDRAKRRRGADHRDRRNPLALVEIPAALRESQRLGAEPLDDPLRGGAAVERAFGARVRACRRRRAALLIAAVSDSGELSSILRAAGGDAGGLDEAEAAGLIDVAGERLRFRHPLVRSAIDTAATSGDKRAVHAQLAAALAGLDDDRAAWHRRR